MQFPSLLAIVITFCVWLAYELKKSTPPESNFWEKENEANLVRRKSLDNLHYITVPVESLPFFSGIDEKLDQIQADIKSLVGLPIVNLSQYTNTELKLMYGPANLTTLSDYDTRFARLARLLFQWGTRLHECNYDKEAIQVLEFGISSGSDLRGHFLLLANLYLDNGQADKIDSLIEKANELHSLLKNTIIKELTELRNK